MGTRTLSGKDMKCCPFCGNTDVEDMGYYVDDPAMSFFPEGVSFTYSSQFRCKSCGQTFIGRFYGMADYDAADCECVADGLPDGDGVLNGKHADWNRKPFGGFRAKMKAKHIEAKNRRGRY